MSQKHHLIPHFSDLAISDNGLRIKEVCEADLGET